jgi:hypothetical protein
MTHTFLGFKTLCVTYHPIPIGCPRMQELLMNREDYLRPLRALLREAVRVARSDLNVPALCRGLMADRSDLQAFRDFEFKVGLRTV